MRSKATYALLAAFSAVLLGVLSEGLLFAAPAEKGGCVMLPGARGIAFIRGEKWKFPYLVNGLVSMWDGEWNAGVRMHNANASTWKDLFGGYDLTLGSTSTLKWGENYLSTDGDYCAYNMNFPHSLMGSEWTCECVYRLKQGGSNYKALFGARAGGGLAAYGLNYYSPNYTGGWNMGIGQDRGDIAISANPSLSDLTSQDKINYLVLSCHSNKISAGANGPFTVTVNGASVATTGRGFAIGRGYGSFSGRASSRCLKADVYTMRIYSRKLIDAEVAANYAVDKARFNLP